MKKLAILACVALQIHCSSTVAIAASQAVKGTKVMMEKPAGFIDAPNFSGFAFPEQAASVMVTELPTPYKLTTAGFDEEHLATRGMHLVSKESMPCGSFDGMLIQLTQSAAGQTFRKWIKVFGDDTKTVMITAAFPDEHTPKLSASMKASVASAAYNASAPTPSLTSDLPFTITGTKSLKLTTRIQNSLLFTSTGKLQPGGNPNDALFIVGQALSDVDVGDKAAFARRRLKQSPQMTDIEILKEEDITISGLNGRNILATATDKKLAKKVFINQILLYGLGSYFIMQGIVAVQDRDKLEPEFQSMAKSFKLK